MRASLLATDEGKFTLSDSKRDQTSDSLFRLFSERSILGRSFYIHLSVTVYMSCGLLRLIAELSYRLHHLRIP